MTIIESLQKENAIIKVYHHQNRSNKGRAASRNLGIQKATMPFIAFLDADDYFLENRFKNDAKLFTKDSNTDGVYNAIGTHFYREIQEKERNEKLMTVLEGVPSGFLLKSLLSNKNGFFSIDGLTVKRSVFEKTGLFIEELVVAEDTDIILKMALKCNLEAGILDKPVAMRGVHDLNVFNRTDLYQINTPKMYQSLLTWSLKEEVSLARLDLLLKWFWYFRFKLNYTIWIDSSYWLKLFINNPRILFSKLSIKYFPLIRKRKAMFPLLFR